MREGITVAVKSDFEYAIKTFRATGELELPERMESIPDNSILGRLLEPYSDEHGDWDDIKAQSMERDLLKFLEVNPKFAPAWQALMRAYSRIGRHKESMDALDKAITIAPYETEFRQEAVWFHITAIKNATEPNLRLGLVGQASIDCTLDALECSYEKARAACIKHLTMMLESKRPSSDHYKENARWMLEWCMSSPERDPSNGYA